MKIALGLEYDGSAFYGWQIQKDNLRTVQGVVEEAVSKVANEPIHVFCAGRTDTGVHALNQVIHFQTEVQRDESAWILGTNSFLPKDVSVKWIKIVSDDFHARYSALRRHYRYIIYNHVARPCILRHAVTWFYRPLNAGCMHEAAQALTGEHDFTSFRGPDCQSKSPFRRVDKISVKREGDYLVIDIVANAFLHHMVRNIVGVLMVIGEGKKPVSWALEILEQCDRSASDAMAPANGLCLVQVDYPAEFGIPVVQNSLILL